MEREEGGLDGVEAVAEGKRLRARGRVLGNQWVWVGACEGPIWGVCSEVGERVGVDVGVPR